MGPNCASESGGLSPAVRATDTYQGDHREPVLYPRTPAYAMETCRAFTTHYKPGRGGSVRGGVCAKRRNMVFYD